MNKTTKEYWDNIHGWFGWPLLYDDMVKEAKSGAIFVEIGVWQGKSTIYLADKIKSSRKKINFFAIDTFEGSPEHTGELEDLANRQTTLYDTFQTNLVTCGCNKYVTPIKGDSAESAAKFEDQSVDFLFIDGGHEYEAVKRDIQAWLPKMKPGGFMAGDDYSPEHWPGVVEAVTELLPDHGVAGWWYYQIPTK